jgi:hypothetical protein
VSGGGGSREGGAAFSAGASATEYEAAVRQFHKNVSRRYCPRLKFYYGCQVSSVRYFSR